MLWDLGSPELSIEHLEYLTLEYEVIDDPKYHNELAHSYLIMIKNRVKELFPEGVVDIEILRQDETITTYWEKLRKFLKKS